MVIKVDIVSGSGNIFSFVNNFELKLNRKFFREFSKDICRMAYSKRVTDGLLVLSQPPSDEYDFSLWFYNPDGSFGMMCGNGARCAVYLAYKYSIVINCRKMVTFDVWGRKYYGEIDEEMVKIFFPPPDIVETNRRLNLQDKELVGDFIDVGSPHFVVDIEDLESNILKDNFFDYNLNELGKEIRFHTDFSPKGTNFDLYLFDDDIIFLRTYEKGVENETGACGTGALATSLSLFLRKKLIPPYKIIPTSREPLWVDFSYSNSKFDKLSLSGGVTLLESTVYEI
ncbi:MAG: diaminopimelate epimerase [Ignavibacteria bacterium]|nr:diaminopimelate epimerase [Ignavibacteria bacterium]